MIQFLLSFLSSDQANQTFYDIIDEDFLSTPSNWVLNNWVINSGLDSPISGSQNEQAYYNELSYLDRSEIVIEITVNDNTSKWGVLKSDLDFKSTLTTFSGTENNIIIYEALNEPAVPNTLQSTSISSLVNGRKYICNVSRNANIYNVRITDTVTLAQNNIYIDVYNTGSSVDPGWFWGHPGVIFYSGDVTVNNFKYRTIFPQSPKVAMYGDSITEGFTLANTTGALNNRWSEKVYQAVNGNALISAKAGQSSAQLNNRLEIDLNMFSPEYCIVLIGSNEGNYSTWLTQINNIITKIEARGAIPILSTILPRATNQAYINQANAWILGQGTYDYIDFAYAVSLNNDRETHDPTYFQSDDGFVGDNIHPNPAGHEAMYQRVITDVPYIFN